jgi:predicted DNA-binding transcriptional regulator AlpA
MSAPKKAKNAAPITPAVKPAKQHSTVTVPGDRFVSIAESEIITDLSRATLYRLMEAGVLDSRKIGKRRVVLLSDLMSMGAK